MPRREPADDEQILRWWNDRHGEQANTLTGEMRTAHTREVVHGELLVRFDESLAELLAPSEWAFISGRLYPDRRDQ